MTVTNHTSLYRFSFPIAEANATLETMISTNKLPYSPVILIDLSDLSDSRQNGSIAVNPSTGRVTGSGTFKPSFGIGTYGLHFCADFFGANIRDTGIFQNNRASNAFKHLETVYDGINTNPPVPGGAWVRFYPPEKDQIVVRVGLSFLDTAKACRNAESEIADFDFEGVFSAATDAWNRKLDVVQIDNSGVKDTLQTVFWSGLYRSMISPQDYTGETPDILPFQVFLNLPSQAKIPCGRVLSLVSPESP